MDKSFHMQWLEQEMERLRTELYHSVDGEEDRLTHRQVVPLSQELDLLIVKITKLQNSLG